MPIRYNPIHVLGLIASAHGKRLSFIPDPLLALEELRAIYQPPLMIDPSVYEIRIIQCQLRRAVDDVIGRLDAQHEAVVLIPHLVAPAAEPAAREDVLGLQGGEELLEHPLALEGRGRVAVIKAAVVGRDDLVGGLEHGGVEEAADGVGEEAGVVDGLEGGFRDFEHDAPVGAFLWGRRGGLGAVGELEGGEFLGGGRLVVGGVVGEDGGAVEGAVVLGEVEPAFVADAFGPLAADADADDVGGAVEEVFGEGDEGLVAQFLDEGVDGHGVDEFLILDSLAVLEGDDLCVCVDGFDTTLLAEHLVLLGDGLSDRNPDGACASMGREAEGGVGTPIACCLL